MSHGDAIGFAQIILTLLIFALGVPALTLASIEDRLRHLLYKYPQNRALTWHMALMLLLVLAILASLQYTVEPAGGHGTPLPSLSDSWLLDEDLMFEATRALLVLLIAGYGFLWLRAMKVDTRSRLVHDIVKRSAKMIRRRGYVPQDSLDDLVVIGECAEAGHGKEIVLRGLSDLCVAIQDNPRYGGADLEPFSHGLLKVMGNSTRPGNDDNYVTAIAIVRRCWTRLQRSDLMHHADRKLVTEVATRLGELAVVNCSPMIASACLDAVDGEPSVAFGIGLAALKAGRAQVALAALSKLETQAEKDVPALGLLLALMAHFEDGESRGRVADSFRNRLGYTVAQLAEMRLDAAEVFFHRSDFITADLLRRQATR